MTWVNQERETAGLHPLLIIALCVVVFLEIHPFQDGNGRLSRVLTTLLLLQASYAYVPYSSLESVVEQSKEAYYMALRQTQGTISSTADGCTGKLFDPECLSMEWFRSREEAKVIIGTWRRHYNAVRPHSSLGYQTPNEFKAALKHSTQLDASLQVQLVRRKPGRSVRDGPRADDPRHRA